MGFHEKWINIIMQCISTVSYYVLVNEVAYGSIIPSRDLRQDDPLSPYLFLLCANGFSSLMSDAARNKMLSGISICRGCPMITHLFFADDSLLFCKASRQECQKLTEFLSSMRWHRGKRSMQTSPQFSLVTMLPVGLKNEVLEILGPMQDQRHSKYLGLPSIIGKSKNEI